MATSGSGAMFTIREIMSDVEGVELFEEVDIKDPKEKRHYKKILAYYAKFNFKVEKRLLEAELGKLKGCMETDSFLHDIKLAHGEQSFVIVADDRRTLRNYSPYIRMGWRLACQKSPHAGSIADMLGLTGFNVVPRDDSPGEGEDLKVFLVKFF